jgi:hypothetical protein
MQPTLKMIPINIIHPSPYQHRKSFSESKLQELAKSIDRDGLIEPIVVRKNNKGYELIAGERRWKATGLAGHNEILSRVVQATDLQARRMCAAENLQREDLSAIETVEAIVEMIDAELVEDSEYVAFGTTPVQRIVKLLGRLDSVRRSEDRGYEVNDVGINTSYKFIGRLEKIFDALPKPVEWRSFYTNDLPLITKLDPKVREWAIANKLNKSQAKALDDLKKNAPDIYADLVSKANEDKVIVLGELDGDQQTLNDLSAKDIKSLYSDTLNNVSIFHEPAATVEWYTPQKYIEAARTVMGGIDIDPASNDKAQKRVKAKQYYTIHDDGFDKAWQGCVWLNPPYGVTDGEATASKWSARLIQQFDAGITTEAILLVNAVIDSKWFNVLWRFPICLTDHRIKFEVPDSVDYASSPVIGSAIIYMGPNISKFIREFSQFGAVVARLHVDKENNIFSEVDANVAEVN